MKDKAVFFDRDGVLNVDVDYLYKIEDLVWVDGAREALAYLSKLGYKICVVTNQSVIALTIRKARLQNTLLIVIAVSLNRV